jgi:hypothetical protein
MNTILRRAQLGLAIRGPFSRNRRRIVWINLLPYAISTALSAGLITFLYHLFF